MKFLLVILMGFSLLSGQNLQRVGEIRLPKGAGEIIAVDGKRKVLVTTRHGWSARGVGAAAQPGAAPPALTRAGVLR